MVLAGMRQMGLGVILNLTGLHLGHQHRSYKMYKLTDNASILRIEDNASIPDDPANSDYAAYLEWVEDGNTPEAADVPPDPTYQENRVKEYPPIGDQLDALYHAGVFPAAMTASIKAIKDKYPKE